MYLYMYIDAFFFIFFSILVYHRILNIVPDVIRSSFFFFRDPFLKGLGQKRENVMLFFCSVEAHYYLLP